MELVEKRKQPDYWSLKAKKLGYPARSVFKLEEIQNRWNLIRPGYSVMDVGAAPGSWTLFALRLLGRKGSVTAVDLNNLSIKPPPGAALTFFKGDIFTQETKVQLEENGPYDCILSDAAPATSGNRIVDTSRSLELVLRVVNLAESSLKKEGGLVLKIFQGGEEMDVRKKLQSLFKDVRLFRPRAVRDKSMETYIIGINYTGSAPKDGNFQGNQVENI